MDAKSLLNALIAEYMMTRKGHPSAFDLLAHGVSITYDLSWDDAQTWLAEDMQERICALAD